MTDKPVCSYCSNEATHSMFLPAGHPPPKPQQHGQQQDTRTQVLRRFCTECWCKLLSLLDRLPAA